ncbi:DedA family protein [Sporomusa malonica]|uniref:Membrane protein DedA, SNARE-associated domain n=1 Tax=Sporomusa malonica TaxID=112901 RepID=A0A1W1YBW6_9FIRM|nr:DedA family protein [Sporomusa malonica]SMC33643.1 membrane protein DedA, SNARE-associated domain [Sporomusa malonica]
MPMELTAQALLSNLGDYGYAAVFAAMLLTGMGLPLPGELTLGFTGYLVYSSQFDLLPAIAATTIGDLFGAMISYGMGFFARTKVVARYFSFLIPSESRLAKLTQWLEQYGILALVFGRLLPVIRGAIPIPAGFVHMNVKSYILSNLFSSLIWCSALIYLGLELGHNWQLLSGLAKDAGLVAAGILTIALAGWYLTRK